MKKLAMILRDSFVVWSRNLTLTYVVMALPLTSGMLIPREQPALETRWLLLGAVLALLSCAFSAGLLNMFTQACTRYLNQDNSKTPSPLEAFRLFGAFIPGVGLLFPQVVLGLLIQVLFLTGLGALLYPAWLKAQPLLWPTLEAGFQSAAANVTPQPLHIPLPSNPADLQIIGNFSLQLTAAIGVATLLAMLTMLWQPFVALYRQNAVMALLRSIGRFFRDPLRLLAICAMAAAGEILLMAGLTLGLPPVAVFILAKMFETYMLLVLFMYVLHAVGRPAVTDQPDDNAPAKESQEA